jgi:hypothetical protein
MPSKTIAIQTACFLLSILGVLMAEVQRQIAYQGILTDAKGNPKADGSYQVTFNLYSSETDGTALWTQTEALATKSGMFATMLGSVKPLSLPFNQQYWLGVAVDGKELAPRIKLAAAAYSLRADTAEVAKTVTNAAHATNADTATYVKNIVIAAGSIDSASIKDSTITGKDINRNANLTIAGLVTSGDVGIGTSSPGARLDAFSASGPQFRIAGNCAGANDAFMDLAADNAGLITTYGRIGIDVVTASAGDETGGLFFSTKNAGTLSKRVSILSNGKVGIGTTSPSNLLTVIGTYPQIGIEGSDAVIRYKDSQKNYEFWAGVGYTGSGWEVYDRTNTTTIPY